MMHKNKVTTSLPEPIELKHIQGDIYVTLISREEYIEAKWVGHITEDDVVEAAKAFLELLHQYPCPKVLNDKSNITGGWDEVNDWMEFEWLPQVVSAGLRCFAHVYSYNMGSIFSGQDLFMRVAPQLQVAYFYERKAAEKWLISCNNTTDKIAS